MDIYCHGQRYILLISSLVSFLLYFPSPASGFGQGAQIQANFRMYCNRRAGQRFPVHADVTRCGGFCTPRNDVSNRFSLRLNATSYFNENIQVSLTATQGGGFRNNIRGFAVIAMTEDETIVGRFSEQPGALVASCDPMLEGDTAFHSRASLRRRSVTLTWEPDSRNYGRVRFRAWVVVQHHEIYMLDSDFIQNEVTGAGQIDLRDDFFTFILQVFNISRAAATIIDDDDDNKDDEDSVSSINNNGDDSQRTDDVKIGGVPASSTTTNTFAIPRLDAGGLNHQQQAEGGSADASSRTLTPLPARNDSVNHVDNTNNRQEGGSTDIFTRNTVNRIINHFTTTTTTRPRVNTADVMDARNDNNNSNNNDNNNLLTVVTSSMANSARNNINSVGDDSEGDIGMMNTGSSSRRRSSSHSTRNGSSSGSSESGDDGNINSSNNDEKRGKRDNDSTSNGGSNTGRPTDINSIRSNKGSLALAMGSSSNDEVNVLINNSNNNNNNNNKRNGINSNDNNNSSIVSVMVNMAGGHSMTLSIPSLLAFEKAFERRLKTTGFDINADDPFHQLKKTVPSFTDLFPRPLPTSTSVLSASLPPSSSGNPFFQAFGSNTAGSPGRNTAGFPGRNTMGFPGRNTVGFPGRNTAGLSGRVSTTTRIRQTLNNLVTNLGRQNSFRRPGQNTNANQFGGGNFGRFGQQIGTGSGFGFPSNTNAFQRPDTNRGGFGTTPGFPPANNWFSRNQPTQHIGGNGFPPFQTNANPFQFPRVNAGFTGVNSLSNSQGSPFSTVAGNWATFGTGTQTGSPNTNSLFGRIPPATRTNQFPQFSNQNGFFGTGLFGNNRFVPQNSGLGIFGSQGQQNVRNGFSNQQNQQSSFFGRLNIDAGLFPQQNSANNVFGRQGRFGSGNILQPSVFPGSDFGGFRGSLGTVTGPTPNNQFGQRNINPLQGAFQTNPFNGQNFAGVTPFGPNPFTNGASSAVGRFQPRNGMANPLIVNTPRQTSLFPFNSLSSRFPGNGLSGGGRQFNSLGTGSFPTGPAQRPLGSFSNG